MYEVVTLTDPFKTKDLEEIKTQILRVAEKPLKIPNEDKFYDENLIKMIEMMLSYVYCYSFLTYYFFLLSQRIWIIVHQLMKLLSVDFSYLW
jgi:hypothetical protein